MKILQVLLLGTAVTMIQPVLPGGFSDDSAAHAQGQSDKKEKKEKKAKKERSGESKKRQGPGDFDKNDKSWRKTLGKEKKEQKPKPVIKQSAPKPKKAAPVIQTTEEPVAPLEKPKNVNAQLKSLNSLKRNINGIVNSSDPKMEPIRTLMEDTASYEMALKDFETATGNYDTDLAAFLAESDELGLPDDPNDALFDIEQRRTALLDSVPEGEEPSEDIAQQLAELDDAEAAAKKALESEKAVSDALVIIDETEEGASEEAFLQAIVDSMNATGQGGYTTEDLTPEMIEWTKSELGFGEEEGKIDEYVAMKEAEAAALEEEEMALVEESFEVEETDEGDETE